MATAKDCALPTAADERTKPPFLRRVRIRGYKSIAACDVELQPLTILVGRNGAGKSNFLDALAFLRDAIELNLTEATKRHGGWRSILSRFSNDGEIAFEVEVSLPSAALPSPATDSGSLPSARYGFVLKEGPSNSPVLIREWFRGQGANSDGSPSFQLSGNYDVQRMNVAYQWQFHHPDVPCSQVPTPRPDRLWLGSFGNRPFLDVADGLRFSGYYNFNPRAFREPQKSAPGSMLESDGRNIASLIETTRVIDEAIVNRVGDSLSVIVEEVERFKVVRYGEYETVRFFLRSGPRSQPLEFAADAMSDGTLRALASLMAVSQIVLPYGAPSVVGIEEPETSLHPAVMRALVAALREATEHTQVLLTTHSADLLEDRELDPSSVLVVRSRAGRTEIAPVGPASREIIQKELYTLADLQRADQLDLDEEDLKRQTAERSVNGEA